MVRMPDSESVFWGLETYMMHCFCIICFCIKFSVPYFLIFGAHCSLRNGGGSWSSTCDAPVPDPRRVSNRRLSGSFPWPKCVLDGWWTYLISFVAY